jgi:hypothetical protein
VQATTSTERSKLKGKEEEEEQANIIIWQSKNRNDGRVPAENVTTHATQPVHLSRLYQEKNDTPSVLSPLLISTVSL